MKRQSRVPRQHPFFSPLAIGLTVVALLLLSTALLYSGGRAFSPGDLSAQAHTPRQSGGFAAHAAFADDCLRCHEPFVGITAARCEACHTTITEQRQAGTGLHNRLGMVDCTRCHSEHEGASANLFADAFAAFSPEHHQLLFPLGGAHTELECLDCHVAERYAGTPATCVGCHEEPALHIGLFGEDCVRCHNDGGWQPARLAEHSFPLDHGDEGQIPCATCHTNTFVSYSCNSCHAPAEVAEEHKDEAISTEQLPACIDCHATGQADEE